MRMLVDVTIPHEPFNTLVREKKAGGILQRILEEVKPEAVYFTERNGMRGATLIVDIAEPSRIPSVSEPFFLSFNADVQFHAVMSPQELGKAGRDALAAKWA